MNVLSLWQDAFILETGQGIYVWEGKKSTRNEKNQAIKDAQVSDSLTFCHFIDRFVNSPGSSKSLLKSANGDKYLVCHARARVLPYRTDWNAPC